MIKLCENCKTEFKSQPSWNQKYCSRECFYEKRIIWNKDLTKETNEKILQMSMNKTGQKRSTLTCQNISKSKKEKFKNKTYKENYVKNNKGLFKKGNKTWNTGLSGTYKHPEEANIEKSKRMKGTRLGINNPNYKKEIKLNCKYCNKEFFVKPCKLYRKYCSVNCSHHKIWSEKSKNRMRILMEDKPKSLRHKKSLRLAKQKRFIELGISGSIGKHEKGILDHMQEFCLWEIKRQYPISGYFIDGYIPELNLAIEIDEKKHYDENGNLREKDITRQKEIEQELGCKFLRIKDKNS